MISYDNARLHISPFNPEIYRLIISPSSGLHAENVSYHTLQTFPENSYGFLELSRTEADKMKKKLNGSILKGKKLQVAEARPRKRTHAEVDENAQTTDHPVKQGSSNPLPSTAPADLAGHELPADRKVKRGWTEPKRKDRKRKTSTDSIEAPSSKYSEQAECLFRTEVPPNRTISQDRSSSKKRNRGKDGRKMVVHEFGKSTTHPTFLRGQGAATQDSTSASFVEGQGWVDQSGKLIEKDPKLTTRRPARSKRSSSPKQGKQDSRASKDIQGPTATTATVVDKYGRDNEPDLLREISDPPSTEILKAVHTKDPSKTEDSADDTSSDGSSSDTDSDVETSSESGTSAAPATGNTSNIPEVHPLEALFKRNQDRPSGSVNKPSLEIKTSFSFFEREADEAPEATVPATPFTRKDLLVRGQRSAAPTPDTAAPTKATFSRSEIQPKYAPTNDLTKAADRDDGPIADRREPKSAVSEGGKEESSFTKWFWENRGDNNRNWKRLRREAVKEKRQKENRRSRLGRG